MNTTALNLKNWIDENRHLLRPPVGNQTIYHHAEDFIVMVVGGPNGRADYHVNQTEEWFYQLEGDIELKIINRGKFETVKICQGDIYLLPRGIPHSPQRPSNTVGLVLELKRRENQFDRFQWYCQKCQSLLHQEKVHVQDIVKDLPPVLNKFWEDKNLTTCQKCGAHHER